MKYSKKFNRDYEFYLKNRERFTFCGVHVDVPVDLKDGVTAKESFCRFDTEGKLLPTKEPDLLKSVLACKKSINLHIKMWVEGYDDMMEGIDFYLGLFEGEPPRWVEDSLLKQLLKRLKRQLLENK